MNNKQILNTLAQEVRIKPTHLKRFTQQWHNLPRFKLMAASDILLALAHPQKYVRLSNASPEYAAVVWRMWRAIQDEADGQFIISKGFATFTSNDVLNLSDIHLSESEIAALPTEVDPYINEHGVAHVPVVREDEK